MNFLGKLSKKQINRGYEILKEIDDILNSTSNKSKLIDCANRFYTLIPHDFGLKKPPLIDNKKALEIKLDMLEVSCVFSLVLNFPVFNRS